MMETYITEQELKGETTIQKNVDTWLLTDSIQFAQLSRIDYVMGEKMAERLHSYVKASRGWAAYLVAKAAAEAAGQVAPAAPSPVFVKEDALEKLLEKITPALCFWTVVEAGPTLHLKITNSGFKIKNDGKSESASLEDVKYLLGHAGNRAEFYTEQLLKFLRANKKDYPEFPENAPQSKTGFTGGIYFGK